MAKDREEELVEEVIKEYESLSSNRGTQEATWLDIARRFIPGHQNMFSSMGMFGQDGKRDMDYIYDTTPVVALGRLVSILESLIMPRNQMWHGLEASDPQLMKNRDVRLYFEEVTRLQFSHRYAPTANFSPQNQATLKSTAGYGTGILFVDNLQNHPAPGLRYRNVHLSEIYIGENHQGIVDRAVRKYKMTAHQAMSSWASALPDEIKKAAENKPDQMFTFLHCVKKKKSYDQGKLNYEGMPYSSYYVALEGKKLLAESGYTSFPYSTPRYERAELSAYGRSPAQDALPGVKTLYEQKKTILKQGQKTVDPVLLSHDDGVLSGFSQKPGALNSGAVTRDGRPLIHPLPVGNITIGKELMDDERNSIKDLFLLSLFQILLERPQSTATEVMELVKEKGLFIAPAIGGLQAEHCGQTIDRELDVMRDLNLLPPMPPALIEAKGEYQIRYNSPFSRAQKSEEMAGFLRAVEAALNVSGQTGDPSPLDHFNWDVAVPAIADITGVPESWMNSQEKIAALRQARSQQHQTQTAIQAAPSVAALVKSKAALNKSGQQQQPVPAQVAPLVGK